MYNKILKEILSYRNEKKARLLARFFKMGKGQYGEGDKFLGIMVPTSRLITKKYGDIKLSIVLKLLKNKYHEVRLIAILILVHKYKNCAKSSPKLDLGGNKKIVDFYLKNTKYINNWDLVDLSAGYIVGNYLYQRMVIKRITPRTVLEKLAKSKNLWERRIAIISTFAFIYKGDSEWTFRIVDKLLSDKHDLIHKACGWMLREVGKRVEDGKELTLYLDANSHNMPRTMLRYAIERLPEKKRLYYLNT